MLAPSSDDGVVVVDVDVAEEDLLLQLDVHVVQTLLVDQQLIQLIRYLT